MTKPLSDVELPARVRQWAIDSVGRAASVVSTRQLHGGMSTTIHSVALRVDGTVRHVVVRQFDNEAWLLEEPDLALHEAESLRRAARTGLRTPQLIALDETGGSCGLPVVMMSRLEGSVVLRPSEMDRWLRGLAATLAQLHAAAADDFPWDYFTYTDPFSLQIPAWSSCPQQWSDAIRIVQGPRPAFEPRFIHRDYHPGNVLWEQDAVSGVVDWVNACRGPAGIDIGHCRVNLAQLYGVEEADAFLSAYIEFAGPSFRYAPYWDLLSLVDILSDSPAVYEGWTALGMTGLTDKLMEERLDAYLLSLMRRTSEA
ncbi:phosphotransferase family protein [Paenibacillus piri]|uniref:Aminoglycoside phosphotransferase family protein n=1 Tax=Paenibacillus piri TaxID=2547395 RepID=A0A4R5KZT5_9BACL|nr:aminoglycoside phosphotransferase family protein [Paenibacillus piri]TDG00766.1 aminoglycoside phosphotransferase family protein [Paenibacillus piri]